MAQLPGTAWQLFTSVNRKYVDGALKDQKPTTKKNGLAKMHMKTVHFRCLSGLSTKEKQTLLEKVTFNYIPFCNFTFTYIEIFIENYTSVFVQQQYVKLFLFSVKCLNELGSRQHESNKLLRVRNLTNFICSF